MPLSEGAEESMSTGERGAARAAVGARPVGKRGKWGRGDRRQTPAPQGSARGGGVGGTEPSLRGAAGTPEDLRDAARGGEGRIWKRTLSHLGPGRPWEGQRFGGRDWGTRLSAGLNGILGRGAGRCGGARWDLTSRLLAGLPQRWPRKVRSDWVVFWVDGKLALIQTGGETSRMLRGPKWL